MDSNPSYEHLISGKLESLPVPDLADAIWSRIELQLDLDMPTDDGGGNGPSAPGPSAPQLIGWGLTAVLAALLSYFILFTDNNQPAPPNHAQPVPENTIPLTPGATGGPPGESAGTKGTPATTPDVPGVTDPAEVSLDTVAAPLVTTGVPQAIDTLQGSRSEPVALAPVLADTLAPVKKKRGVGGLTDGDYRIAPVTKDGKQ